MFSHFALAPFLTELSRRQVGELSRDCCSSGVIVAPESWRRDKWRDRKSCCQSTELAAVLSLVFLFLYRLLPLTVF